MAVVISVGSKPPKEPEDTADPEMPDMAMPMEKAWNTLKALPEQQMFVNRPRFSNLGDEAYDEYSGYPMADDQGHRSLGTVHPAIYGMLERKKNENVPKGTLKPTLNLDLGRELGRELDAGARGYRRGFRGREDPEVKERRVAGDWRTGRSIQEGPQSSENWAAQRHLSHDQPAMGNEYDINPFKNWPKQNWRKEHPTQAEQRAAGGWTPDEIARINTQNDAARAALRGN